MYFELLNEPDSSDNYYKYLEVCCYQKVNTIKRMRFNRKISVLVTNHFKIILFSNLWADSVNTEQLIIVQISQKEKT